MLEKLASPPLIEAICEFRFSSEEQWNWTVPGQLYDLLKLDGFSERGQRQAIGIELSAKSELSSVGHVPAGIDRVQMKQKDGSAMVQVGPHLLSINLSTYSSWDDFLKMILNVLEKYSEIASRTPFKRIGLRYINQILIDKRGEEIGEYIQLDPPIPPSIDRPLQHFYQRYEFVHDEPEGILIHQTGLIGKSEESRYIMLDFDFTSSKISHLKNNKDVSGWLTLAHAHIEDGFVASINPALLKEMKEGAK